MKYALALAPVLASLLAMGCSEQVPKQRLAPTALPTSTPAPTTTPTTTPTTPVTAIRAVMTRSPYGDLRPDNLFLDGDFEFTGRNGQMPWLVFSDTGQATIGFDTGGNCFSGLRCASLKKDIDMVGFVAVPGEGQNRNINVSVVARTSSGACKDVTFVFTDLISGSQGGSLKPPAEPAEDHWCHFSGAVRTNTGTELVLYVRAIADQVWVDQAYASINVPKPSPVPDGPGSASPVAPVLPITKETATRVQNLGAWIRGHRIFGDHASLVREGKIQDDAPPKKHPN